MTFLNMKVGDIVSSKENQKILKQLLFKKNKVLQAQDLISSINIKIKEPRFK